MNEQDESAVCCPVFQPEPWDKQVVTWENQRFIKASVHTIWYMPVTFGAVVTRLMEAAKKANALAPQPMLLADSVSPWSMDLYLAVEGEVPGHESVAMSGRYVSKVYDGPFKDQKKWMDDFAAYAESRGLHLRKTFAWYTTCPKCAKKHGHNYVVMIGEVAK